MAENMYGERLSDGQMISILDIPVEQTGLKCECVCPDCKALFEACSLQGQKVAPYFRHYTKKQGGNGTGNGIGCNVAHANETALHKMAKQILLEERRITAPAIQVCLEELYRFPDYVAEKLPAKCEYQKAALLNYKEVSTEERTSDFQPDAKIVTQKGTFLIEIAVTHFVDYDKEEKAKRYGLPMIEIDLSNYTEEAISKEKLREIIVGNSEEKSWVYHPSLETAKTYARKYYDSFPIVRWYLKKRRKEAEVRLHEEAIRRQKQQARQEDEEAKKAKRADAKAREAELDKQDRQRILNADYNQNDKPIFDRHGFRWMKCVGCNTVMYGYKIVKHLSLNKGLCRSCKIASEIKSPRQNR